VLVLHYNALAGGATLRISGQFLRLRKREWLYCLMLKTARLYLHSSRQNTGIWRTDGQTDGQNASSNYIVQRRANIADAL